MTDLDDRTVCTIESTRDRQGHGPVCLIRWDGREWYASIDDVRRTAEDLFLASAFADMVTELLAIGLPAHVISTVVSRMLTRTAGKRRNGGLLGYETTIDVMPAGSSQHKTGLVIVGKGNTKGELTPIQAREMGRRWHEAAEASDADTLFEQVLGRSGLLSYVDLDSVFALLMDIRTGVAEVPPA